MCVRAHTRVHTHTHTHTHTLQDTDSIVRSLQFGIGVAYHFIMGASYLSVWGVDVLKGFSTFSALVLAFTFVFGNSVRNVYESMLFLFVEHAYDVSGAPPRVYAAAYWSAYVTYPRRKNTPDLGGRGCDRF